MNRIHALALMAALPPRTSGVACAFGFPDPPAYVGQEGSSSGAAAAAPGAGTIGGARVVKVEKLTFLSPEITADSSPEGDQITTDGTAKTVKCPAGAKSCIMVPGAIEPNPGTGAAADLAGVGPVNLAPDVDPDDVAEGDSIEITPSWLSDDAVALAAKSLRIRVMVVWLSE